MLMYLNLSLIILHKVINMYYRIKRCKYQASVYPL